MSTSPPPAQPQPEPPRPQLPLPSSAWGGPDTYRAALPSWDETPDGDLSWLGLLACLASALVMLWLIASGYWLAALGFILGLLIGWRDSLEGWFDLGLGVALGLLVALVAAIVRGGWW